MPAKLSVKQQGIPVPGDIKAFSVAMALLGSAGLVLKSHWGDHLSPQLWSYGGNVTASFAVFFIVGLLPQVRRLGSPAIAAAALLGVESFELTDGFGVMSNGYDPVDLGANLLGVSLAFAVERAVSRAYSRLRTDV